MSFGRRLRNLRLENNMTQKDLSKKLNVSRATVGRYETDERFPDKDILKNIADVFGVSIDYLLNRTDHKNIQFKSSEPTTQECIRNAKYEEMYNEITNVLVSENLVDEEKDISQTILENIIKYGIEAAIKIAKLEKQIEKDNKK